MDDYAGSAQALAATTLRNVLGTRTLGDILSDRVKIAQEMHVSVCGLRFIHDLPIQDLLADGTLYWGVSVERVEVKDVRVPEQLMRAMAAEAEAAREARAKVRGVIVENIITGMMTTGYRCGGGTQEQPGADACGAEYCQVPCSAPGHFHWQRRRHNLVSLKINDHFSSAPISPDPEQHRGGEQLDCGVSRADGSLH